MYKKIMTRSEKDSFLSNNSFEKVEEIEPKFYVLHLAKWKYVGRPAMGLNNFKEAHQHSVEEIKNLIPRHNWMICRTDEHIEPGMPAHRLARLFTKYGTTKDPGDLAAYEVICKTQHDESWKPVKCYYRIDPKRISNYIFFESQFGTTNTLGNAKAFFELDSEYINVPCEDLEGTDMIPTTVDVLEDLLKLSVCTE